MRFLLLKVLGLGLAFVLYFNLVPSVQALGNPVKISTSTNAPAFPQVVSDSAGYLHMIWMEVADENTPFADHQNPGILYSRWNGDIWSTPLKISENTDFAEMPAIALDSNRTLHAVWDDETYDPNYSKIAYKTRSSTGTWSSIEILPVPTGTTYNWIPRVAVDNTNTPHVVFTGLDTNFWGASLYYTKKVSGAWTTPEFISKDELGANQDTCQWSDLRSDSSGDLHLLYWCWQKRFYQGGIYYTKFSAGSWSTPVLLTNSDGIEFTRMAVSPGGQIFASWYLIDDSSVRVRWTVAGVWQPEAILTTSGERAFWGLPIMGVTTDSKERAHVGWGERDEGGLIDIRFKTYTPGSGWGAVQDVDLDNNDADSPFIYPDKWDNQHFAWTEKNPSTNQWEIYYRVAEGTIQTVQTTGATITANPNNITYVDLSIPNGALSSATQIGIQIGPVPESIDPIQVTIPRAFTFRPHGLVFNAAATATIYYDDAELGGADERQLKPWVWNSQTNAWEARVGSVNRAQNKISVSLSSFSLYGISAPLFDQAIFLNPSPNEVVKQAAMLFEFQLNYKDGSEVVTPELPEDLKVLVKDRGGNTVQTLMFEPSAISKDEGKNRYKVTLNFQKDRYENGEYALEVHLTDVLLGSTSFIIDR